MEDILEWKVEMKTEYSEPRFPSIDRTSYSYFLSISHSLHCNASDLNFVKNYWIVSKLLGCNAISSFSNMFPRSSSYFPNNDSSFSQYYLGFFNPTRFLGDVSAQESKLFIQLIQELIFLSRMMRFCLSTHMHPKQAKLVQRDMHIFPLINIVEGCKYLWYKG